MSGRRPERIEEPPPALWSASARLASWAGVAVVSPWAAIVVPDGTWWGLAVCLDLAGAMPTEHVPTTSIWVVAVNTQTRAVRVYPGAEGDTVTATFWHQDFNGRTDPSWAVRSGYLCTREATHGLAEARAAANDEPVDLRDRVLWHVARTQEWLRDAALGNLTRGGAPFELPDYRTRGPSPGALAIYEDGTSLAVWRDAPRVGWVDLVSVGDRVAGALVTQGWTDHKGRDVYRPPWGSMITGFKAQQRAAWVRLDALPVVAPWQAPSTGAELVAATRAQGIDLVEALGKLWRQTRGNVSALVIGSPIPKHVGGNDAVMHWQLLRLPPRAKGAPTMKRLYDEAAFVRALGGSRSLDWLPTTENWHPDVIGNRGRLRRELREMRIVLAGAGALGSIVADVLVRMGVRWLVVVDHERYEAGNGVRHRLSLTEVGALKAPALADRLNTVSPSAEVRGYAVSLPTDNPDVTAALAEVDLILDCTASDSLLADLSGLGLRQDAHVVTGSVGLEANRLYVFGQRAAAFSAGAFERWFAPYRQQEHDAADRLGLPQAAGCWHPVTPVPFHRLLRQAGLLVERLEEWVAEPAQRMTEVHSLDDGARLREAA